MTETAERLASKTSRQNEALAELKQSVKEIKSQVDAVRNENREIVGHLRDEIKKIRAEVALGRSSPRAKLTPHGPNGIKRDSRFLAPSDSRSSGLPTPRETFTSKETVTEKFINPLTEAVSSLSIGGHRDAPPNEKRDKQQPGQFLRQVRSKTSLSSLNKRTEHPQKHTTTSMRPVNENMNHPTQRPCKTSLDTVATSTSDSASASTSKSKVSSTTHLSAKNNHRSSSDSKNGKSWITTHAPSPSLKGKHTSSINGIIQTGECSMRMPCSLSGSRSAANCSPEVTGPAQAATRSSLTQGKPARASRSGEAEAYAREKQSHFSYGKSGISSKPEVSFLLND